MPDSIARLIDHALLHPTLTDDELRTGCEMARRLCVAAVCIKPYAVPLAAEILRGSGVAVCTVIGFPHGSQLTEVKALEARLACQQGATELDMVVNVGKVLSRDWRYVENDIRAVVETGRRLGAITKVIFETEFLDDDELKIELCRCCERAGAAFVKTSTGFGFVKRADGTFGTIGATDHDLQLMRAYTGAGVQIKASGGVRTYAAAQHACQLGATRIGTSSTETIVAEERRLHAVPAANDY